MSTNNRIISKFVLSTQLTAGEKRKAVYLLLQDQHVLQQREEYENSHRVFTIFEGKDHMIFPSEFDWLNDEWFYYIILKQ